MCGRGLHGGVYGAQDDGQRLVDEDEDDAHLGQVRGVGDVLTPEGAA